MNRQLKQAACPLARICPRPPQGSSLDQRAELRGAMTGTHPDPAGADAGQFVRLSPFATVSARRLRVFGIGEAPETILCRMSRYCNPNQEGRAFPRRLKPAVPCAR
jgi:hypothetical protein